tara:strand:- start:229 stop:1491 length:1263 start_codon:yes stop_codon:yes gene_type:complete
MADTVFNKLIWLVKSHEPLPGNQYGDRLFRCGMYFELLSRNQNNKVTWWSSSYSHYRKLQLYNKSENIKLEKNKFLNIIKSPGYKSNKSIFRLVDHLIVGVKFFFKALFSNETPDLIICSFPIFSTAFACLLLKKVKGIPYVIDYRDDWPEVFWSTQKGFKKDVIYFLTFFHRITTRLILSNAYKITSINDNFLKLAHSKINRKNNKKDFSISFSYIKNRKSDSNLEINNELTAFIKNNSSKLIITFIGTFGHISDVETIYKGAYSLTKSSDDFAFIFCGTGDKLQEWSSKYSSKMILNTGFVNNDTLSAVLRNSQVGILPYLNSKMWSSTIPNKFVEYLSEGLFLYTSLKETSLMGEMINEHSLGSFYDEGSELNFIEGLNSINIENLNNTKVSRINIFDKFYGIEKLQKQINKLVDTQ